MKSKELSEDLKHKNIEQYKNEDRYKNISTILNTPRSAIQCVVRNKIHLQAS